MAENEGRVCPLTDVSAEEVLHDARMAAMRKLHRSAKMGDQGPQWAVRAGQGNAAFARVTQSEGAASGSDPAFAALFTNGSYPHFSRLGQFVT